MNNEEFKEFITPFVDEIVGWLGGLDSVRVLHVEMPATIVAFVAGGVYSRVANVGFRVANWRDDHPFREHVVLNQEEIRRTFDLVRLRLETESTTS